MKGSLWSFAITYARQHYIKLALWLFIIIPLVPFVLLNVALMVYMYWPISYDKLPPLPAIESDKSLTILAHGLHATPAQWSLPLKAMLEQQPQQQVIALDWSAYAKDAFRCSIDGKRIGQQLGERLAQQDVEQLHLIAHSCGSFVIVGLCQSLKAQQRDIKVHTTYLDPVSVYGGLWWNYGISHFGQCADFSDAYIDPRDGIPGSDRALEHAYTFDVSPLSQQVNYQGSPHQWPVQFYLNAVNDGLNITFEQRKVIEQRFDKNQLYKKTRQGYNKINQP